MPFALRWRKPRLQPTVRFSSLLLSDHFPVCGGAILEPELRQLYYRALEGADTFRRTSQGGQVPPGSGVEAGQPDPPALQPKRKAQPPQDSKEEEKPAIKEETPNYSPDKSPEDRKEPTTLEEEAASEKKKKKPRPRSPAGPPPPRAEGYGRWEGPIPAYRGQEEWPRYPDAENKGVKKRKQQALFAEFKAWRKNKRAPRAKAKGVAKAKVRVRGILRRPAKAGEAEELGDKDISEAFEEGKEVAAAELPFSAWRKGVRLIFRDATYWEEKVQVVGVLQTFQVDREQVTLKVQLEGTRSESLVKWSGAQPHRMMDVHLCHPDCGHLSKDGLLHVARVQQWKPELKEAWMDNLIEVSREPREEMDELAKIRERAQQRAVQAGHELGGGQAGDEQSVASSSPSRKKKKKKKKKRSREDEKEKSKVSATKDLTAIFGNTALDPSPTVRKRIKKKARRIAKKKGAKGRSDSSTSGSTSGSQGSEVEGGRLFGEEVRVKSLWKAHPGALTLNSLEYIQNMVVTQAGQMWSIDTSSLPPLFSQFWRMILSGKATGAMAREMQTLCFIQDLILQGKIASAADVITQRLKGLEQVAAGSHYSITQRQELVPVDNTVMTTPTEALEASRLHREEARAKAVGAAEDYWELSDSVVSASNLSRTEGVLVDGESAGHGPAPYRCPASWPDSSSPETSEGPTGLLVGLAGDVRDSGLCAEKFEGVSWEQFLEVRGVDYRGGSSSDWLYRVYLDNFDTLEKMDRTTAELIKGGPSMEFVVSFEGEPPVVKKELPRFVKLELARLESVKGDGTRPWAGYIAVHLTHDPEESPYLSPGWQMRQGEKLPTFTTARPRSSPGNRPAGLRHCQEHELARWRADDHRYPPYVYRDQFCLVNSKGEMRLPSISEKEVIMGFPLGYTSLCLPKNLQKGSHYEDVRHSLIGNSWHVPVVSWLMMQLFGPLCLTPQKTLGNLLEAIRPGSERQLQGFLKRLPLRETKGAVAPVDEVVLAKKLTNFVSVKGLEEFQFRPYSLRKLHWFEDFQARFGLETRTIEAGSGGKEYADGVAWHRQGLFQCEDRVNSGKELGEEELLWSREYASGGAYQFWSLGQPKVEIENLCSELKQLEEFEGFSAVILGCGLGLDVAHLASAAAVNAVNGSAVVVGGVDFAWKAIEVARSQHGAAGCFFYHADVCELPAPSVPLDMVIDNTVFQNVFRSGRLEEYLETLTRISTEGHTLLHLNLMSREGVEQRPQFREAMEQLNLPLLTRDEILGALGDQWQVTDCREGHYDLKPEGAGLQCDAFYSLDSPTPGIPSWCIKALRQKRAAPIGVPTGPNCDQKRLLRLSGVTCGTSCATPSRHSTINTVTNMIKEAKLPRMHASFAARGHLQDPFVDPFHGKSCTTLRYFGAKAMMSCKLSLKPSLGICL
ncbi:unnamed protein product [Cladocopium goreaui]|uniref:Ankyrin repeat domain-containing protein 7 n=1 Tax=Cladocopium goreaui TaxID=2562237 RepID=A0A9P1CMK4_9DINO|nr:unnamed protein product [Cladocopium goreaui]